MTQQGKPSVDAAPANSSFGSRKRARDADEAARIAAGEPEPETTRTRTSLRAGVDAENPIIVVRDVRA